MHEGNRNLSLLSTISQMFIIHIPGKDMDESSATDDSDEEEDEIEDDEEDQGMAGSLGDIIKPSLLKKPSSKSPERQKSQEPIEIKDSAEATPEKEVQDEEEEEEEEDLQDVIDKKTKDLMKKKTVDLKVGKKVEKKIEDEEVSEPVDNQKIMELLELEMRARAIKSLLSKTKTDEPPPPPVPKKEDEDDQKADLIKEVVDPEEAKRKLDEEKRLHKAREALSVSIAKKREEDNEIGKLILLTRFCIDFHFFVLGW